MERWNKEIGERAVVGCRVLCAPLCMFILVSACVCVMADDVVIIATGEDQAGRVRKHGTVVDFTGKELRLRSARGGDLSIPSERVIDIETIKVADHRLADRLFAERNFAEAAQRYHQAQNEEERVWMRRRIVAQRVWCLRNLEQMERAGDLFLILVQSDPVTQYFDAVPLSWRSAQPHPQLARRADVWLRDTKQPAAQLMGASWLLPTNRRGEAVQVLRDLQLHSDRQIAHLAMAQLWRTAVATVSADEVARWQVRVQRMSPSLRAGPYHIIGQALVHQGRHQAAALAMMRVPILFAQHRSLAGESLLASAAALQNINQSEEATALYREVIRDYVDSPAAAIAERRLEQAGE